MLRPASQHPSCEKSSKLLRMADNRQYFNHRRQSWGLRGRDPQILKWVRFSVKVREGKEWEWEGKTPMFQNILTPLISMLYGEENGSDLRSKQA
jgi:hypothetical protein